MAVSHPFFADDLVLFSEANLEQVRTREGLFG